MSALIGNFAIMTSFDHIEQGSLGSRSVRSQGVTGSSHWPLLRLTSSLTKIAIVPSFLLLLLLCLNKGAARPFPWRRPLRAKCPCHWRLRRLSGFSLRMIRCEKGAPFGDRTSIASLRLPFLSSLLGNNKTFIVTKMPWVARYK